MVLTQVDFVMIWNEKSLKEIKLKLYPLEIWYLKKITWLAFAGFMAGALAFLFIEHYIR